MVPEPSGPLTSASPAEMQTAPQVRVRTEPQGGKRPEYPVGLRINPIPVMQSAKYTRYAMDVNGDQSAARLTTAGQSDRELQERAGLQWIETRHHWQRHCIKDAFNAHSDFF